MRLVILDRGHSFGTKVLFATREHAVTAGDMPTVLSSGVSRQQIEDALAVCFAFNITGAWRMRSDLPFQVGRHWMPAQTIYWLAAIGNHRS
jgi:hypothetical protein